MTRQMKRTTAVVSWILWLAWDPIGWGVPRDEYESYVRAIVARLPGGVRAVAIQLNTIRTKTIGLKPNRAADKDVARQIIGKVQAAHNDVAPRWRSKSHLRSW